MTPLSSAQKGRLSVFLMMTAVFCILFAGMPKDFYRGDAVSIKMSAIYWVNTGSFGFAPKDHHLIEPLLESEGQYYILNPANNRYYPRWEVLNGVLHAVPELFQRHRTLKPTPEVIFRHNVFNALLGSVVAGLLLFLASFITPRKIAGALFVCAVLFASYEWNYLRAQTKEIFLLLFVFAMMAGFWAAWGAFQRGERLRFYALTVCWNVAAVAMCLISCIYHVGYLMVILLWGFLLFQRNVQRMRQPGEGSLVQQIWQCVLSHRHHFLILGGFLALSVVLTEWAALVRYDSWHPQGISWSFRTRQIGDSIFGWQNIFQRMNDYLMVESFQVALHCPLLFVAATYWRSFWRDHKNQALYVLAFGGSMFFAFCCFEGVGEWAYGPRFLVPLLPLFALPACVFFDRFMAGASTAASKASGVVVLGLLMYCTALQLEMNKYPFFHFYEIGPMLETMEGIQLADDYKRHHHLFFLKKLKAIANGADADGALGPTYEGWPDPIKTRFQSALKHRLFPEGENHFFFQ
ncbi:MAG: hypothetical protein CMH56_01500 [Myxococcales bacterium]|nr:hypothetical protein [Myxococcales bacterium]